MALHKNLTGSDLHETKVTTLAGSPVSLSTIASIAGVLAADVTTPASPVLYVAKSTTAGDWGRVAGGGGGGGGFQWSAGSTNPSPLELVEYDQKVFKFVAGGGQSLYGVLKVPNGYVAGNPISMILEAYSPSTSNNWQLKTTTTLVRAGTDAVDSITNQHASTTAAYTNTTTNLSVAYSLDLTSGSGQVNSVAVAAGDILKIELYRSAVDTDTADLRLRSLAVDFTFA